jgi:peptidoglycan hydrolase-like protein with peptidoglycan-binding domain
LAKKGHEAGAVDGVWGENTRQALRDFQREHDLEETGTLTLPTLAALGIDVTSKAGQNVATTAQD